MRHRTRLIILAALVGVLVSGPVWAQGRNLLKKDPPSYMMLVCEMTVGEAYYLLQRATGKARRVDVTPVLEGEVEVKENIYIIRFSKDNTVITVNRYTGIIMQESDKPPPLTGRMLHSGTCKVRANQRRF